MTVSDGKGARDGAAVERAQERAAVDAFAERDGAAVDAFVERFAGMLAEAGFPRMPARIFTALLAADSGALTAAELAESLQVSPAAVSGGVRYLAQVNLIGREREAGTRRDRYRVYDDVWYEAMVRRDEALLHWERSLREGIDALGPDSPAGERLADSLAFFAFMREELPTLLTRWHERRARLRAAVPN